MNNQRLDEREFELINIVGMRLSSNQRELSRHMEMSLGMTNMLIRRLISKGFIRIRQLNKKKVEYILTPKGFSEKMRKSVKYTMKTLDSIGLIKNRVQEVIIKLYQDGERNFFILGQSDLVLVVEMVFQELNFPDYQATRITAMPEEEIEGVVLICTEKFDKNGGHPLSFKRINFIEELAKDLVVFNFSDKTKSENGRMTNVK